MKTLAGAATFTFLIGPIALALPLSAPSVNQNGRPGSCAINCPDVMFVSFDENGNATVAENGGPAEPLVGQLIADPSDPTGGALVLTYMLPEPVFSGDVSFAEPGDGPCSPTTASNCSDWVRFTDSTGVIDGSVTDPSSTLMIFYSNLVPGDANNTPDLADVPFPSNLGSGNYMNWPPGEVNDGFDYDPNGPYPGDNEYVGTSPSLLPEPSSLIMLASAVAVMVGLVLRRR